MLIKFVDGKKDSWSQYLDTCVYAYNSSRLVRMKCSLLMYIVIHMNNFRHESSKHTPFEVMFGRRAVLPIDLAEEKVW